MKKTQISTTAKGVAAIRAIESGKPAGRRICYDPFARSFTSKAVYLLSKYLAGYGERVSPGTQGFIVCRCRYFDDSVDMALRDGFHQLVILGAGLDSRAYRTEVVRQGVKVFEVDHPGTQAAKLRLIHKTFRQPPPHVVYVPIDFNDETLDKLLAAGFDPSQKTLFLWEGVTYYLTSDAVDTTLAWIRSHSAPRSRVIFDYVYQSALDAGKKQGDIKRLQRYRRFTGESLTFGIEQGKIESFMHSRGYTGITGTDAAGLEALYCIGPNQGRKVAGTYAIVHAETA